jgi:hypothetical protein
MNRSRFTLTMPESTQSSGIRRLARTFLDFYRQPYALLTLLVTSVMLCYVGGAVLFYVHSIYYREGGPAISPLLHWALDSSFAFVALTPALALIIPIAAWVADRVQRFATAAYVVAVAALFSVVTTPGPLGHDLIVARDTPLAKAVTQAFGDPSQSMPPPADYTILEKIGHQVLAGPPTYLVASAASFLLIGWLVRRSPAARRSP